MKKPHILIVEPQPRDAQRYQGALAQLDAPEFSTVAGPDEALARLRSGQFDLLVAHLNGSAKDSFELLRQAREVDAELPMIVITAQPSVDEATASLRLGAGDYLAEPVDSDALAASARRLLSGRRL